MVRIQVAVLLFDVTLSLLVERPEALRDQIAAEAGRLRKNPWGVQVSKVRVLHPYSNERFDANRQSPISNPILSQS